MCVCVCVCVCVSERASMCVSERASVCVSERASVCVCVREREKEKVCVCVIFLLSLTVLIKGTFSSDESLLDRVWSQVRTPIPEFRPFSKYSASMSKHHVNKCFNIFNYCVVLLPVIKNRYK